MKWATKPAKSDVIVNIYKYISLYMASKFTKIDKILHIYNFDFMGSNNGVSNNGLCRAHMHSFPNRWSQQNKYELFVNLHSDINPNRENL